MFNNVVRKKKSFVGIANQHRCKTTAVIKFVIHRVRTICLAINVNRFQLQCTAQPHVLIKRKTLSWIGCYWQ